MIQVLLITVYFTFYIPMLKESAPGNVHHYIILSFSFFTLVKLYFDLCTSCATGSHDSLHCRPAYLDKFGGFEWG